MDYIELTIQINNSRGFEQDTVAYELGELGFESFEYNEDGLKAYCVASLFDEKQIKEWKESHRDDIPIDYSYALIKEKNWNEIWEKNYFSPIVIGNECVIHSSFHHDIPTAKYDILIDPKMSFGTGHHETTILMIQTILKLDLVGKSLLDMGCGTGILAILASMRGASPVTAIDIDEWAYTNSLENFRLNGFSDIEMNQGGAELLSGRKFDIILANINRNILLADIHHYSACLTQGDLLVMSGFYDTDRPAIDEEAQENNLILLGFEEKNKWVATLYQKK
ncbi:50S ribosomal protein L11 methyltransferase [Microbacter margulisiae]|uniref:Ribosomal protein L11 methyltransferase n=1 Tax=Microbacter margulisiae TaxID=1350067 RepID=A0A7W5DPC6_9PORP|nr:50S ribosomal protein L11 methyltransferase [Microbacter margulisiae]MBB3186481.1 ribosomal protein L11 methyltransferase [Microbacter margulisiae]